jgi:hypothetical protein
MFSVRPLPIGPHESELSSAGITARAHAPTPEAVPEVGDVTSCDLSKAASIEAIAVVNADRSKEGNAALKGEDLLIFDHELSFRTEGIVGWKAPWQVGSLEHMKVPGNHIFWEQLKGRNIDFPALGERWKALSDAHFDSYLDVQPVEWIAAQDDVKKAIELIKKARDNMDDCLTETKRVLQ